MADRVSASITLGGVLPRALLEEFVAVVAGEALSTEWDGPAFLATDIRSDGPLDLMAHQVPWGRFEELEGFCIEHGLRFARWCEAYPGGWDGERLVFDGAGEPRSYRVTDSDTVVLALDEIRAMGSMEAVEAHFASADIAIPALTFTDGETGHG